jgi:glycosyltransferase involved in cell wall biosynthesis
VSSVTFSIVVPTLGRVQEIARLIESLERQTLNDLEVIIVDQNDDDRLGQMLSGLEPTIPVQRMWVPGQRGASRARNTGLKEVKGDYVVFADDDCWYPPELLQNVTDLFKQENVDVIGGRAVDETGKTINGRFEETVQDITATNVWTTSIEWMLFFKREALETLGGFDEAVGVGADSPWQSAEGQDIVIRALKCGFKCVYYPDVTGHHLELNIFQPDDKMLKKARAYARGMGFVLRKHDYGLLSVMDWVGRPAGAAVLCTARLQLSRARYYAGVATGRLEGFMRHVL